VAMWRLKLSRLGTKRRVEDGGWRMENGEQRVESGEQRVETGEWILEERARNSEGRIANGCLDFVRALACEEELWLLRRAVQTGATGEQRRCTCVACRGVRLASRDGCGCSRRAALGLGMP
jgi:hypothetical protein